MFRAVRILSWSFVRLASSAVAACTIACGPPNRGGVNVDGGGSNQHADGGGSGSGSGSDTSKVFAHSSTTLYRVDTSTFQAQMIGTMPGLGTEALTDIAIDKNDQMVGVTSSKLYSIDSTTGSVTLIKALAASVSGLTSLSYVPVDPGDPNSDDILVTANAQGAVFKIDPTTGAATQLGSYGTSSLGKVSSSGDIVGVRGLGIYATVNVGTETNDYLAKIDPVTWKATILGTSTGFNNIFGLGFWAGKFYGFVDTGAAAGKVIQIDQNTGAGTMLEAGAVRWYGAGVSTNAPILE
ncbi:hypothetical protein BH11MYX1_BH11MYX1_18080 [soil metagenome]